MNLSASNTYQFCTSGFYILSGAPPLSGAWWRATRMGWASANDSTNLTQRAMPSRELGFPGEDDRHCLCPPFCPGELRAGLENGLGRTVPLGDGYFQALTLCKTDAFCG